VRLARGEELAAWRHGVRAAAVTEQTEVANVVEALGESVQQEATQELDSLNADDAFWMLWA
jgi:hypothetical protein